VRWWDPSTQRCPHRPVLHADSQHARTHPAQVLLHPPAAGHRAWLLPPCHPVAVGGEHVCKGFNFRAMLPASLTLGLRALCAASTPAASVASTSGAGAASAWGAGLLRHAAAGATTPAASLCSTSGRQAACGTCMHMHSGAAAREGGWAGSAWWARLQHQGRTATTHRGGSAPAALRMGAARGFLSSPASGAGSRIPKGSSAAELGMYGVSTGPGTERSSSLHATPLLATTTTTIPSPPPPPPRRRPQRSAWLGSGLLPCLCTSSSAR